MTSPSDPSIHPPPPEAKRFSRRLFMRAAVTAAVGGAGVAGYGFAIEPRWPRLERPTIWLPGLPAGFDGFTIGQLSDLHRSPVVPVRLVDKAVSTMIGLRPDLVMLTGDYVTGRCGLVHSIAPALARLAAARPTVAILGNHDHWTGPVTIERCLRSCGIEMMTNRAKKLRRGADHLWLLGTDDLMVGADDLPAALAQARGPGLRLLMTHNPDSIHEVAAAGIDLMICGHTHGGQVALPFVGPLIVPSEFRQ